MFKFLKDKLKDAAKKFSKEAEEVVGEDSKVEEAPEEKVEEEVKEEISEELEESFEPEVAEKVAEEVVEESKEEIVEDIPKEEPKVEEKPKEKLSFKEKLKKAVSKKISEKKFEELFWELEMGLLESNVAVEVIDKLKEGLKMEIVDVPIKGKVDDFVLEKLKENIKELFKKEVDLVEIIKKSEKPYVIVFLGVNGSGKTLSVAKVAKYLKNNGLSVIMAAGDTFRAAGNIQLVELGKKLDMPVMMQPSGSDSCALIFDTIKKAKLKDIDVVLADTAGRMHSNENLMEELDKIVRINKPDFKLLVAESITGNDVIFQSKAFEKGIGIDGFLLSKADIDEKGGAIISVSYVLDKPILFLGTGQGLGDLEKFNLDKLLEKLDL